MVRIAILPVCSDGAPRGQARRGGDKEPMQLVFHLGGHCTDDGRLIRSISRSRAAFADGAIHIPGPRGYRSLLRETLGILNGAEASEEVQSLLIDALTDTDDAERILLFHENLLCLPPRIVSENGLYAMTPRRLKAIASMFPAHDCEFYLSISNPAALVPSLVQRGLTESYDALMGMTDPYKLRWWPTINQTLAACPDVNLTIWCNEDAPLVWPQIMRGMCQVPEGTAFEGDTDMATALLSDEGAAVLTASLASDPPSSAAQWADRISAALVENGKADALELNVDLPGWTEEVIDAMSELYLDDCARIAGLPGVRFLTPPG